MNEPEFREPTHADDAEVSLLGAAMSGADIDDLTRVVEASDFYNPAHEAIWAAIIRVHNAGNRPDPVSVRLALDSAKVKHDPIRLVEMTQLAPSIASADYYAEQVAAAAAQRALQYAAIQLDQLARKPGDVTQMREDARAIIDKATAGRNVTTARTIADILPSVIDHAERGAASMLSSGWSDLDSHIGGLAPGRLVVFAARPGGGKSIAGTNLALHMAGYHGHAVLLASLEMPEIEVGQRLLAAHAVVNLTQLQNGTATEANWQRIAEKQASLDAMPITIDAESFQTVAGIRRAARDLQRTRDDLALIVVDYLQLVQSSSSSSNRAEQVTATSRELKLLARETGACVVAMAQVNREGAKADDGPRLTDLREGGIENDADQVILMHRPDLDLPEVRVNVAKNRHGSIGVFDLNLQGQYARLVQTAWTPRSVSQR